MRLSMTDCRHKILSNYSYSPILWTTFLPAVMALAATPWITFGWPTLSSEGTREDKGQFGSERPSFALFSKYL